MVAQFHLFFEGHEGEENNKRIWRFNLPPAPSTATFVNRAGEVEKERDRVDRERTMDWRASDCILCCDKDKENGHSPSLHGPFPQGKDLQELIHRRIARLLRAV